MTQDDLKFIPHSDMSISDVTIVNQHNNLIKNEQFSDATALLDNNNYQKGFRASLFNSIQNKIRTVQEYVKGKDVVEKDEVISITEPVDSEKQFWIQDY